MVKLKVHFRIPEQIKQRFYGPGMKALCGNRRAKRFDVSANEDAATCKPCLAQRTAYTSAAEPK